MIYMIYILDAIYGLSGSDSFVVRYNGENIAANYQSVILLTDNDNTFRSRSPQMSGDLFNVWIQTKT
jgi:hypothetical protein